MIDKTLMPKDASGNVRFASNQLVLCYTDKSKFADTITEMTEHLRKNGPSAFKEKWEVFVNEIKNIN